MNNQIGVFNGYDQEGFGWHATLVLGQTFRLNEQLHLLEDAYIIGVI